MGHGYDLFDLFDTIGGGRGYYGDGFGGDDFRSGFAPVSDRAYRAQDQVNPLSLHPSSIRRVLWHATLGHNLTDSL